MADEDKIEDLPNDKQSQGGASQNPWVPLIVLIVLVPLVSNLTTKFITIPTIQKHLKTTESTQSAGHEGQEIPVGPPQKYKFDNIVANISGTLQARYVKVSFTVEGRAANFKDVIESNKAKLIDATITLLSSLTLTDLEEPGIQNKIRSNLLSVFETKLNQELIQNLYFSEFVVQ